MAVTTSFIRSILGTTTVGSFTTGDQELADLVLLPDGGFVVSYYDFPNSAHVVDFYNADGVLLPASFTSLISNPQQAVLSLSEAGEVYLVYPVTGSATATENGLQFVKFASDGGVLLNVPVGGVAGDTQPTTTTEDMPQMAILENGNIVLAYEKGNSIVTRVIDPATGATVGFENAVSTTIAPSRDPAITALADGGYAVSWTVDDIPEGGERVHVQAYNADGSTAGRAPEFVFPRTNSNTDVTSSDSSIIALPDGKFAVAVNDLGQNFPGQTGPTIAAIGLQIFNSAGSPAGAYQNPNNFTAGNGFVDTTMALVNGALIIGATRTFSATDTDPQIITVDLEGDFADQTASADSSGATLDGQLALDAQGNTLSVVYTDHSGGTSSITKREYSYTRTITGDGADDVLEGTDSDETLDGGGGIDYVEGGDGDDILIDQDAGDADILDGGAGDDIVRIIGDGYNTSLNGGYLGGAGSDTLDFSGRGTSYNNIINLSDGSGQSTYFAGFENYIGNDETDQITGSHAVNDIDLAGGANIFNMGVSQGAGVDIITTNGAESLLTFEDFQSAVWVDLAFSGNRVWTQDAQNLTNAASTWREIADVDGFDVIRGSAFSDYIAGDAGDNTYLSINFFDYVQDQGFDFFDGRGGMDTADFSQFGLGLAIDLTRTGVNAGTSNSLFLNAYDIVFGDGVDNLSAVAELRNVETIIGTSVGQNLITVGAGSYDLIGGDSNDIFSIKDSNTSSVVNIDGGAFNSIGDFYGNFVSFAEFTAGVWVNLSYNGPEAWTRGTMDIDDTSGTFRYISQFENITSFSGSLGIDYLQGDANSNWIVYVGSAAVQGTETINGLDGIDTIDFGGSASAVWVDLDYAGVEAWTRDTANVNINAGTYREIADLSGFENIAGSFGVDYIVGNDDDNEIFYRGTAAFAGVEVINGEGGDDTLDFSDFGASVWVNLGFNGAEAWTTDNTDQSGTYRAIADVANVENLMGTGFDDFLRLAAGSNGDINGGFGDDHMIGGTGVGTDTLIGGAGSNLFDANGGGNNQLISDSAAFAAPGDFDTFLFRSDTAFGTNTIFGFDAGVDKIRFTGTTLDSFADVQAAASDTLTGVLIDPVGGNGTVLLSGSLLGSLSESDFIFG